MPQQRRDRRNFYLRNKKYADLVDTRKSVATHEMADAHLAAGRMILNYAYGIDNLK